MNKISYISEEKNGRYVFARVSSYSQRLVSKTFLTSGTRENRVQDLKSGRISTPIQDREVLDF